MATTNVSFQCTSQSDMPFQYALTAAQLFVGEATKAGLVVDSVDENRETGIVWVQVSEKPAPDFLTTVDGALEAALGRYPIQIEAQRG
jgi:hypothetical protein